ncbi:hypothetical protein EV426DRAFT_598211 [Tirmania nivea]|nr:hypothetical protein EV426DRAFT_598211 [Tirmania nivea]
MKLRMKLRIAIHLLHQLVSIGGIPHPAALQTIGCNRWLHHTPREKITITKQRPTKVRNHNHSPNRKNEKREKNSAINKYLDKKA